MRWVVTVVLLGLSVTALATENVSVPWEEVKALYKESVERKIMDKTEDVCRKTAPQLHTIEEAAYRLSVGRQSARVDVLLSGRVVKGGPEPIPLFDPGIVLGAVRTLTGGVLLCREEDGKPIVFLPGGPTNFQMELTLFLPVREDSRSQLVSFSPPAAIRGSLTVALPPQWRMIDDPGIADSNGVYRLPAGGAVTVRFSESSKPDDAPTEVDLLSTVHFRDDRPVVSTLLVPVKPVRGPLVLRAPAGFRLDTIAPNHAWSPATEPGACRINVPADTQDRVSVDFVAEAGGADRSFTFALPTVEGNIGREGLLTVRDPDDGQIMLTSERPIAELPAARLGLRLGREAGLLRGGCLQTMPGQTLTVALKRLAAVSTPPIVLDTLRFFASFEENGGVLSVLELDVPAEVGPRLRVKAVPGAEVWSLTVNGEKRKVYANGDGAWVIPLMGSAASRVQLAFLCTAPKLGLQGRLETAVPETGLPARHVIVGLALPERVQVLSVEGPVNPDPAAAAQPPPEFAGKPHYFSRSFYKGEGMPLAVFYKEPVKETNTNKP